MDDLRATAPPPPTSDDDTQGRVRRGEHRACQRSSARTATCQPRIHAEKLPVGAAFGRSTGRANHAGTLRVGRYQPRWPHRLRGRQFRIIQRRVAVRRTIPPMGVRHSAEATGLVAALQGELAAAGAARGESLVWSAAEQQAIDTLIRVVDRRAGLRRRYNNVKDVKSAIKLSVELRQCDNQVMRLLAAIKTDIPKPESRASERNRAAANVRWQREHERNTAVGGA